MGGDSQGTYWSAAMRNNGGGAPSPHVSMPTSGKPEWTVVSMETGAPSVLADKCAPATLWLGGTLGWPQSGIGAGVAASHQSIALPGVTNWCGGSTPLKTESLTDGKQL